MAKEEYPTAVEYPSFDRVIILILRLYILDSKLLGDSATVVVVNNLVAYRYRLACAYPFVVLWLLERYGRDGDMWSLTLH